MAQEKSTFAPNTCWIWGESDRTTFNIWRYFRQTFSTDPGLVQARLLITADTSYECCINGVFLGRGPVRAFPEMYRYDVYDVTPLVKFGMSNTAAFLVQHLGEDTQSYMRGRPGLLVELILDYGAGRVVRIGSDSSWRTLPCTMFNAFAPRISLPLEFEEQIDARLELIGWEQPGYNDSAWGFAAEVGPAGCSPWTSLEPRDIPFLTENAVYPKSIKAIELARTRPGSLWSLDIRHLTGNSRTGFRSAPPGERGWILFTEVITSAHCEVRIHPFPTYETIDLRVNDTYLRFNEGDQQSQPVTFNAGRNLVMMRNVDWPALLFETDQPLTFSAERFIGDAAWVFSGPFNENNGDLETRWTVAALDELPTTDPRQAVRADENRLDIAALTASQVFFAVQGGYCATEISRPTPRPMLSGSRLTFVDASAALLHNSVDWTTIYPQPDGDVHLVLDFGQEIIGFLGVELDAAAGTILDANMFEGIDDGGIFWMQNVRNSVRYICRDGVQTFKSHRRRGFRYLSLTCRDLNRPLRIRCICLYSSTYPVEQRGSFASSDEVLNRIWQRAVDTVRLCMLDTYVDCPGYEQVFWIGDARISAAVNNVAFGAYALTGRCNRLVGQSLRVDLAKVRPPHIASQRISLPPAHMVSGWHEEIPAWSFLWIWTVWEQYWNTGDSALLAQIYPDVRDCLSRCAMFLTERDLLDVPDVWNLIDWAPNDMERHGEIVVNSILMAYTLTLAAKMAQVLEFVQETAEYLSMADRIRTAINRHAWSEHFGGYVDTVRDEAAYRRYVARSQSQSLTPLTFESFQKRQRISEQTNTLALLCDCAPPERHEKVLRFALAATEGNFVGGRPEWAPNNSRDEIVRVGSPWFLFFTLETLFKEQFANEAIEIIRTQWSRMLEAGATTFWETFPGHVAGGHWSRSLCHAWSAGPAYFLSAQVLGVTPLGPGYSKVRIAPHPGSLTWASGTVPTPRGDIFVSWKYSREDGSFTLDYHAPDGCEVEVSYGTDIPDPGLDKLKSGVL